MKRLIKSRVDNPNIYLNTEWYNPNEGESFKIDKIVGNEYELEYPNFYDYVETYDFDMYIEDNYLEQVAKHTNKRR